MTLFQEIMYFAGAGIAVVIGIIWLINFLSNGWFLTFMIVKASRGKKVLVRVISMVDVYFKSGFIDGEMLIYKNRAKNKKRVRVLRTALYRCQNVNMVDVDDEVNSVLKVDMEVVPGFDAVKLDNLIVRALYAPQVEDQRMKLILIICVVGALLGAASAYFGFRGTEDIALVKSLVQGLVNAGQAGGVIP